MHRDIKPQNILVENNIDSPHQIQLKLADLGLGRAFSIPIKSYTHEIVTLWYRAPEVLLGASRYGLGVDIWSVACIFAELNLGIPFFQGNCELQQPMYIFMKLGTPNSRIWPSLY